MTITEKTLKDLEARIKAGKMTPKEALEHMPVMLRVLKLRTKRLEECVKFIDDVGEDDRLWVKAWRVWRRKVVVNGKPIWSRANAPVLHLTQPEPEPEDVQTSALANEQP